MTIFSKIISGEIPSYKISESDKFFAFLDIHPIQYGHTLVVPKIEVDKIFDVPDDYLKELLVFSKPIAHAIEKTYNCNRVNILTIGLDVPHAHVHLIPIKNTEDMLPTKQKLQLTPEEFKEVQRKLLMHL